MYFRRPYASSSVNPQSAASPYMVPTCPPGYTVAAVKKGPDGTIYSYTCAMYSSQAGRPVCPAGFTMMKHGNQFTCTRIGGSQIQKPWPGPLPHPPTPKRGNPPAAVKTRPQKPQRLGGWCGPEQIYVVYDGKAHCIDKAIRSHEFTEIMIENPPQCQPGQFYSEDLGCYWPGQSVKKAPSRPKPKFPSLPPAPSCPPGQTWTEDLGCVDMTPQRTKRSKQHPCPPGKTWTEDLGCVDTQQYAYRRGNPPAPWPGQTDSEFCPDGWVFKTGQSCQPTEYPPHPLMDKNDAWVLVPKYGYGGWGPKSGMPATYQGSVWERYSEWRKDFPHVAKNVLGPRPKTDTGWTSVVAYSKKSGWMWWMVRAKYANFGTHPLPPPVPPKPKRAKYYPPLPEPIP